MLPYFPFYFCSEQSLWVTFRQGGGWETRKGDRALSGRRGHVGQGGAGRMLCRGQGREGGSGRSPASVLLALPAVPDLAQETSVATVNCIGEKDRRWQVGGGG